MAVGKAARNAGIRPVPQRRPLRAPTAIRSHGFQPALSIAIPPSNIALWAIVLLATLLFAILPLSIDNGPATVATPAIAERIAYLEYGPTADTLWVTDAVANRRQRLMSIPHAPEFGAVPSLSPDGRIFVYAALPPGTLAPTADSPAELWLAGLRPNATPSLLSSRADLLVPAVWSPDATSVVFRRSAAGYRLYVADIATGSERELVMSPDAALFPVAFADANTLFYIAISATGSDLRTVTLSSGADLPYAHLSNGLTRDWKLSSRGDTLAYLVIAVDGANVVSRALIYDLAAGRVRAASQTESLDFGPTFMPNGELTFGRLINGETTAGVTRASTDAPPLAAPDRGFDVPLAWSPRGEGVLARSFENASITAPGRATLTLIDLAGNRVRIAAGEITLLGWIPH
jgi:hypothetical protein